MKSCGMKKQKNNNQKKSSFSLGRFITTHTVILGCVLLVLILGLGTGVMAFENTYKQRFFPGVVIGEISVAGLTYTQALDSIEPKLLELESTGLHFVSGETELIIPATVEPVDPGTGERILFSVDPDATVEAAYTIGRSGSFIYQLGEQIKTLLVGKRVPVQYFLNEEELVNELQTGFSALERPPQNAEFIYDPQTGEWSVTSDQSGQVFQYENILSEVHLRFNRASSDPIQLQLYTSPAKVTEAEAETLLPLVKDVLELAPLSVVAEDHSFELGQEEFAEWLAPTTFGVGLNHEAVQTTLDRWGEEVNQPAKEGKFKFVDGQIEQFEDSQEGKMIDVLASIGQLRTQLIEERRSEVSLIISKDIPAVTPDNIQELGIQELLGTGHSNKSGSPYNRQLNIARGAELLNGLLIPPGEEFSLLDHLRPFTTDNGYYAELVIKDNKTTPEIGGGLCQIGTTTFRAAMNAGLDITERRNHSYAVSYYFDDANNLPGTDATIYDPSPDMKFINDTGHWMLFETKIEGNDLYFSFYGTNDGRKAYFTPPQISGWVAPPPTKEVEDSSLAPGEQKCTERAHAGTTSSFDYIIEYADGTQHQETFSSVYKPWQAVCLVGPRAETTTDTTTETESESTDSTDSTDTSDTENVAPPPSEESETSAPDTNSETKKKKKK